MLLDSSQLAYINSRERFTRLLAPAGTGKTICILHKCAAILSEPEMSNAKFLIITFTRAARDELKSRIESNDCFGILRNRCMIETLNSWGYQYLRRNVNGRLRLLDSDNERYFLFNNILRPIWAKSKRLTKIFENKKYAYKDILSIFDILKTLGFRHDMLDSIPEHLEWIGNSDLERFFKKNIFEPLCTLKLLGQSIDEVAKNLINFSKFWKKCTDHLFLSNIITFEDQKYWCLIQLERKYENRCIPEPNRYHTVFIDEFQDINPLDLFLIKKICELHKRDLSIVGDDDQAIFEWRGATPRFIVEPELYFDENFKTFILEKNYRYPKNIVELSMRLINHNTYRITKTIIPTVQGEAEVKIINFPTHLDALNLILNHASNSTNPKELGIISRKKSQLIPTQITLISNDIFFYAKEDLNILLSQAYEGMKDILVMIATKDIDRHPNDVINNFVTCCNYVRPFPLNSQDRSAIKNALYQTMPKNTNEAVRVLMECHGIPHNLRDELSFGVGNLLSAVTVTQAIDLMSTNMKGLQQNYVRSEDDIFYKDPPFMYLAEYARKYDDNFMEFIKHIQKTIAKVHESLNQGDDVIDQEIEAHVHLMTAYRAKGKEFENVIVLDVNNGIWPIKYAETREELEQERRLMYVALTRTKKKILFIVVNNILGYNTSPSPYLHEMGLM
ncbi:MAG: UvrD-helicase domain-containing protein [bacterium]